MKRNPSPSPSLVKRAKEQQKRVRDDLDRLAFTALQENWYIETSLAEDDLLDEDAY
jgi:hypothetical protein